MNGKEGLAPRGWDILVGEIQKAADMREAGFIGDIIWESLIWPLSPCILESVGSNLTIGTLVERGISEHQS